MGEIADVVVNERQPHWTLVLINVSLIVHQSPNFANFLSTRQFYEVPISSARQRKTRRQRQVVPDNIDLGQLAASSSDGLFQRQGVLPIPPKFNADEKPNVFRHTSVTVASKQLSVSVPTHCRVHGGQGRFVFIGRFGLERSLRLSCASRLDEFQRLWIDAVKTGQNPCVLNT